MTEVGLKISFCVVVRAATRNMSCLVFMTKTLCSVKQPRICICCKPWLRAEILENKGATHIYNEGSVAPIIFPNLGPESRESKILLSLLSGPRFGKIIGATEPSLYMCYDLVISPLNFKLIS